MSKRIQRNYKALNRTCSDIKRKMHGSVYMSILQLLQIQHSHHSNILRFTVRIKFVAVVHRTRHNNFALMIQLPIARFDSAYCIRRRRFFWPLHHKYATLHSSLPSKCTALPDSFSRSIAFVIAFLVDAVSVTTLIMLILPIVSAQIRVQLVVCVKVKVGKLNWTHCLNELQHFKYPRNISIYSWNCSRTVRGI